MWNKIYLLVLAVCAALMAFFTYYSWSWLKSIGAPQAVFEGYLYHSGLAWKFLWISSIALLILANAILAKSRRPWAMWTTLVYFGIFVVVRFFVVDRVALTYFRENGFTAMTGPFPIFGPIVAVVICTLAAAVIFADQFVIVRLTERMYPTVAETEPENVDEVVDVSPEDQPKTSS